MSSMKHRFPFIAVAFLLAAVPATLLAQQPPPAEGDESQLIAVLQSDAPLFDKAKACQRLAVIGTKKCVPVLAKLIADKELSHYARTGLEPIPDPSVDAALRDALGKLEGGLLAGVINSVGMRRDAAAVADLKKLLGSADPAVAGAAAWALGRIATPEAVKILRGKLAGPASLRPAVADACLTAADSLLAADKQADAVNLLDALREADMPAHIQIAALQGAIRARGPDGLPLLVECLRSKDKARFRVGLQMVQEMGGPEMARALMQELKLPEPSKVPENAVVIKKAQYGAGDRWVDVTEQVIAAVQGGTAIEASNGLAGDPAPGVVKQLRVVYKKGGREQTVEVPEKEKFSIEGSVPQHPRQVLLIYALGDLGEEVALPVVSQAAKCDAWDVSRAAIRVLGELGDASAVPVLLAAAVEESGVSQTAQQSLAELKGEDVNAAIAKALDKTLNDLFWEESKHEG